VVVKNTYLDQINNNRITVNGMIYTLSTFDLENLNPGKVIPLPLTGAVICH